MEAFPTLGAAEAWLDSNLRKITLGIWDPDDDDPAADPAARYSLGAYAEAVITARENRPIHPLKSSQVRNRRPPRIWLRAVVVADLVRRPRLAARRIPRSTCQWA